MSTKIAIATAHPNIAFVKYWGNQDSNLRLPSNGSISMTLSNLTTETSVQFDASLPNDILEINQQEASSRALDRVSQFLDRIRNISGMNLHAEVKSSSNFPISAGLASSASAFAALSLAASKAAGLDLDKRELSTLARLGSGSACRSIFGGYVEWMLGASHKESFAEEIAPPEHWELHDVIAILEQDRKAVGSTEGHALAESSPLQKGRLMDAPRRLRECRLAISSRDFARLSHVAEQDSNMMHAVMMTSTPSLLYWSEGTIRILRNILKWREEGLEVFYTMDAGSNVHCICTRASFDVIERRLRELPGIHETLHCGVGEGAKFKNQP